MESTRLQDIVSTINSIIRAPSFTIIGIARRHLVYMSNEGEVNSIYALDLEKREKKKIVEDIHMLAATHPSSDYVVFIRDVTRGFEYSRVYAASISSGEIVEVSADLPPQRVLGLAFDGVNIAWSGSTREQAGIYTAKLGSKPELVLKTSGREFVSDVNERFIVGYGHLLNNPFSTELFIVDLASGNLEVYTPRRESSNSLPKLNKEKILFASDYEDLDKERLYVFDIETRELSKAPLAFRDLELFDPVEYVDYDWLGDNEIWAIGKRNGNSRLFVNGKQVGLEKGFISSCSIHGSRAFIVHSTLKTPPRIISIDLEKETSEILVDNKLPDEILSRLGEVRYHEIESYDGVKIPIYVLESNREKPGPTIVYPHGGPWSEVANSWSPIIATLAALGYHVVAPNFRGSTGYGQRFRKMDIGDPGGGDMEDVAAARNWAVKTGLAREDSVGILGYSYGGYTTLMQLTRKPKLWRCGVAGAPVADWEEMYELADAYFKRFEEILFAGRRELFKERSPITYIENIEAPLAIIQPENDSRTPLKPVLRFVERLAELNKTFEFHVIPEIGHAISLKKNALAKFLIYSALFLDTCFRE